MSLAWADPDDRLLARSIFGTDDVDRVARMIADWAIGHGFGAARVTAIELSIGAAVTLALEDRTLFLKAWPGSVDATALGAQLEVQRRLSRRGFPTPALLAGPAPLGPGWAAMMAYARPGEIADPARSPIRRAMAAGLARLIEAAEDCRTLPGLPARRLPPDGAIWPPPHNALFDFAATARGAEAIDAHAADALKTLRAAQSRIVVGHCDWSARNLRMQGDEIAIVYDWDSVFLERETIVVGSAAATFPMSQDSRLPQIPSIAESAAFVRDYEEARGAGFTSSEIGEIEAAATYARAYAARCEHAIDPGGASRAGSSRWSLAAHGPFRFSATHGP